MKYEANSIYFTKYLNPLNKLDLTDEVFSKICALNKIGEIKNTVGGYIVSRTVYLNLPPSKSEKLSKNLKCPPKIWNRLDDFMNLCIFILEGSFKFDRGSFYIRVISNLIPSDFGGGISDFMKCPPKIWSRLDSNRLLHISVYRYSTIDIIHRYM